MNKDEVLTLIKEGKIKELNQIDKEFILEEDILDFFSDLAQKKK